MEKGGGILQHCDRLWPGGPVFFYDDALFPPVTDTFLLSAFTRTKAGERVCDLGAGTGLLGLLLMVRQGELTLHNVELQPAALALAEKTMEENNLAAHQHCADLRALNGILPAGNFDLVVSNPPYFAQGHGYAPRSDALRLARGEAGCTIEEVCAAAGRLLRWGGRLSVVYRPERLCDLLWAMRQAGIEPKRLRTVQSTPEAAPSLLLCEGRRGGRPGLSMEPPLLLKNADGGDSEELHTIYFRSRNGDR